MLEALEQLLEQSGLDVVGRCTRPADLDRCLTSYAPDVALVDAELAEDGDVAGLIRAVRRGLGTGRLVLLAPELDAGPGARLARARGRRRAPQVRLRRATSSPGCRASSPATPCFRPGGSPPHTGRAGRATALSERQLEVLELLAQGLPNELIAERLFISKNTVKFHVAAIYERLGVHNRVQAAHALAELRDAANS